MNPKLKQLHPYPFEKLKQLKHGIVPPAEKSAIALSIGEPKHGELPLHPGDRRTAPNYRALGLSALFH